MSRFIPIFLVLLAGLVAGLSAEIRVTSWNLRAFPSGVQEADPAGPELQDLSELGGLLKEANSDVIVLQEVKEARTAQKLAMALGSPDYQVVVCSAFQDQAEVGRSQLAILSRIPALSASAQEWQPHGTARPPGGFAFAVLEVGGQKVVVYALHLKRNEIQTSFERDNQWNILQREISMEQLMAHIAGLKSQSTNSISTFIVAGNFNTNPDQARYVSEETLRLLQDAGFRHGYEGVELAQRITCPGKGRYPDATLDYIFARGAAHLSRPTIQRTELSDHFPVTAQLLLERAPEPAAPPPVVVASARSPASAPTLETASVELAPPKSVPEEARPQTNTEPANAPLATLTPIAPAAPGISFWWWLIGLIIAAHVAAFVFLRGKSAAYQAPAPLPPQWEVAPLPSVVPAPAIETGPSAPKGEEEWRQRALAAERRAQDATAMVKSGLFPHLARLMRNKLVGALFSQREYLLETQQQAAFQVAILEERLAKIQEQLNQRLGLYERRIIELEHELAAKEAQNRELLQGKMKANREAFGVAQPDGMFERRNKSQ
jgi:endonuclease/exonuclease/phosphatase family metal-dependent hydrolase